MPPRSSTRWSATSSRWPSTDTAHHDLPLDFNRVYGPEKSLLAGRLALEIARAPWKIPALVRFGRNAQVASARLAEVLCAAFTSPAA